MQCLLQLLRATYVELYRASVSFLFAYNNNNNNNPIKSNNNNILQGQQIGSTNCRCRCWFEDGQRLSTKSGGSSSRRTCRSATCLRLWSNGCSRWISRSFVSSRIWSPLTPRPAKRLAMSCTYQFGNVGYSRATWSMHEQWKTRRRYSDPLATRSVFSPDAFATCHVTACSD